MSVFSLFSLFNSVSYVFHFRIYFGELYSARLDSFSFRIKARMKENTGKTPAMKQNAFVLKCIGIYSIFANFACYADLCVFCCSCSCSFVLLFSSSSYHLKFNVCTGAIMSIVCNTVRLLCCAIPRSGLDLSFSCLNRCRTFRSLHFVTYKQIPHCLCCFPVLWLMYHVTVATEMFCTHAEHPRYIYGLTDNP